MAKDIDVNAAPPSADQIRMALLQAQMAEAEKQEKLRSKANQELTKFTDSFLKDQVNEDEIAMVRRLVMNAVKNGKYEALVYSFPSDLCTDSGRPSTAAIRNGPKPCEAKPSSSTSATRNSGSRRATSSRP